MAVSLNTKAFGAPGHKVLVHHRTPNTFTGTLTQTSQGSFTIPAGTLSEGDVLRLSTLWTQGGTLANARTLRVKLNGTEVQNAYLTNTGSSGAILTLRVIDPTTIVGHNVGLAGGVGNASGLKSVVTVNLGADIVIDFTVVLAVATDTSTLENYVLEHIKP